MSVRKKILFSFVATLVVLYVLNYVSGIIIDKFILKKDLDEDIFKVLLKFKYAISGYQKKKYNFQNISIKNFRYNSHFDWTKNKYKMNKKIIFMGDSCTEGWVNSKNKFPLIFNYLISKQLKNYIVIDAGIGGMTSTIGLKQLKDIFINFKPKIIVWFYVWNDIWQGEDAPILIDKRIHNKLKTFLLDLRKIDLFLLMKYFICRSEIDCSKLNSPPALYKKNLKEVAELCRNNNIKLILLTAPTDLNNNIFDRKFYKREIIENIYPLSTVLAKYNGMIITFAKENKLDYIDLAKKLKFYKSISGLFKPDHIHYTFRGNRIIAEILFDYFKTHRILKK